MKKKRDNPIALEAGLMSEAVVPIIEVKLCIFA
jgi:hypothetical protein